ncbi:MULTISPECIES: hypothetical protein [unclassified Psychrobacter]|uniref:hypothetical protein n=1 Tax=unclassified Psychrobacter TaxID=196806 RepID=UPI0025F29717|nr:MULTISPECIES: hypothetical protein [unclassified Psychrobacter]
MAFLPKFLTYKTLASGKLVPVMQQYQLPTLNVYAVYHTNRFLSQRWRYLIDFIVELFDDDLYWNEF